MTLKRLQSIVIAISLGLVFVCAPNAQAMDCGAFLSRAIQATSRFLHLGAQVPASYSGDYKPEEYARLSLSDRYIETYKRIASRNLSSGRSVFFYDYEVKDTIAKMGEALANARDFANANTEDEKRHLKVYKQLLDDLTLYKTQERISYVDFHETSLQFAAFVKKGLGGIPPYQLRPKGRYSLAGHDFTNRMTKYKVASSGFNDLDNELNWQIKRSQLLRKAPQALFIPTLDELDENFFNGISSYPVFPVGLTTNPHIIVDGQLYGPVLFLLHDFYHAGRSLGSISYLPADIKAREQRRLAFNQAVAGVEDQMLNRTIRMIFNFVTHEEHRVFPSGTIVISHSRTAVSALKLDAPRLGNDVNMFEEIQTRIYDRPHDFGEMFGDEPPSSEVLFEARQWVVDFFRADTYYP